MEERNSAVLLIDADRAVHEQVSTAVTGHFAFYGATTVDLGLRIAARRAVAVIVIGAQARDRTPEEILDAFRASSPGVRAVFLTAVHDRAETSRLAAVGGVVATPLDAERLLQAIRTAVRLRGMTEGVEELRTRTGSVATTRRISAPAPPPPSSRRIPSSNDR